MTWNTGKAQLTLFLQEGDFQAAFHDHPRGGKWTQRPILPTSLRSWIPA
ncbi:hypothetical protein OAU96_00080 [Planctomycetota bacterium]|nr:hypothetical protein [Planctomycetota bacterium]